MKKPSRDPAAERVRKAARAALQPTGALGGIIISAVAHEGLVVTINGRPGRLAVLDEDGHVVAEGELVAREAEAVAMNEYRNFLEGEGHLRVYSGDLSSSPKTT